MARQRPKQQDRNMSIFGSAEMTAFVEARASEEQVDLSILRSHHQAWQRAEMLSERIWLGDRAALDEEIAPPTPEQLTIYEWYQNVLAEFYGTDLGRAEIARRRAEYPHRMREAAPSAVDVSDETFERDVLGCKGWLLLDLYPFGCEPCLRYAPVLERFCAETRKRIAGARLADHLRAFTLAKMDSEAGAKTFERLAVNGAVILFHDGKLQRAVSHLPTLEELASWADAHIFAGIDEHNRPCEGGVCAI